MQQHAKRAAPAAPYQRSTDPQGADEEASRPSSIRLKEIVIHSVADTIWWLETLTAKLLGYDETAVSQRVPAAELSSRMRFVLDILREQVRQRQMVLRGLALEADAGFAGLLRRQALEYGSLLPFVDAIEAFAQHSIAAGLEFPGPEKVQLLRMVSSAIDLAHELILAEQQIVLRWHALDVA